ncbi:CAP domain-containing protein [Sphaerotilus microaerophilus]|uniref:CAP domain-containing protein n=1 Tax=Sphaerotilus microaerophilus TaxID=2914710 RepID=UPI002074547C|nr:CAP domain-containing protein [Sphaerotilus sp. FB-5]
MPSPSTPHSTPSTPSAPSPLRHPVAHANPPPGARPGTLAALLAATLVLPACQMLGGEPAPALAATAAPALALSAPVPPPALPGNCGLAETAAQALAKLNDYRAAGARCGTAGGFAAAAPLAWQPALAQLAAVHSRDMAGRASLAHSSGGRNLTQRLDALGYAWQGAAENVAAGQPRLALVLADWVSSPLHCANLMNASYSEAGLACQRASDGTPYWTLILAKPR